jgi:inorganic triphosphatase YgiF
MTYLKMDFSSKPRPGTVEASVKALCSHILSGDKEAEECWQNRGQEAKNQVDTVLCRENLEAMQDLLDDDDAKTAEQIVNELEQQAADREAWTSNHF